MIGVAHPGCAAGVRVLACAAAWSAVLCAPSAPRAAELLEYCDPQSVFAVFRGRFEGAELSRDDDGDAVVLFTGRPGWRDDLWAPPDYPQKIWFHCTDGDDGCEFFLLEIRIPDRQRNFTLEDINDYNSLSDFTVYHEFGEVVMAMGGHCTGGVTVENLDSRFGFWGLAIRELSEMVDAANGR